MAACATSRSRIRKISISRTRFSAGRRLPETGFTSDNRTCKHMDFRIGQGYDVHALVPGRPLIIGGVTVPYDRGLLGHSDADVLLHAITDALFGAAAMGDIGRHFPDTAREFAGADSRVLLRECAKRVTEAGFVIGTVDSTVMPQAPKLAPHIAAMRANIA